MLPTKYLPTMIPVLIAGATGIVAFAVWFFFVRNKNQKGIGGFGLAIREHMRHILAGILVVGTTAGTLYTFSDKTLAFNGGLETLLSVGGIVLALEFGVIFCGTYIGELDARITTERRKKIRQERKAPAPAVAASTGQTAPAKPKRAGMLTGLAGLFRREGRRYSELSELERKRRDIMRWFYLISLCSAVANYIYRDEQLKQNHILAGFVSLVPILLIVLFTIKLQPLPVDYDERSRREVQKGLGNAVVIAAEVLHGTLRQFRHKRGMSDDEWRLLSVSMDILKMKADPQEVYALEQATTRFQHPTMATPMQTTIIDADDLLTVADLKKMYGWSERTAQNKLKATPGYHVIGNKLTAPRSAIYKMHGTPPKRAIAAPAKPTSTRKPAKTAKNPASDQQKDATEQQEDEKPPQDSEDETQEADDTPNIAAIEEAIREIIRNNTAITPGDIVAQYGRDGISLGRAQELIREVRRAEAAEGDEDEQETA